MSNPFGNSFDDFSDDTFLNADEIRQDLFDESVTPNKSEPKEVSRPKKSLAEDLGLDVDETLIEEKPSTQSTSKEINVTEEEGIIEEDSKTDTNTDDKGQSEEKHYQKKGPLNTVLSIIVIIGMILIIIITVAFFFMKVGDSKFQNQQMLEKLLNYEPEQKEIVLTETDKEIVADKYKEGTIKMIEQFKFNKIDDQTIEVEISPSSFVDWTVDTGVKIKPDKGFVRCITYRTVNDSMIAKYEIVDFSKVVYPEEYFGMYADENIQKTLPLDPPKQPLFNLNSGGEGLKGIIDNIKNIFSNNKEV